MRKVARNVIIAAGAAGAGFLLAVVSVLIWVVTVDPQGMGI